MDTAKQFGPRKLKYQDLMGDIEEVLSQASGEFLAQIHNQICSNKVRFVETKRSESYWKEIQDYGELSAVCPHCGGRNTARLSNISNECHDCGKTYNRFKRRDPKKKRG